MANLGVQFRVGLPGRVGQAKIERGGKGGDDVEEVHLLTGRVGFGAK
jgi:hypothetical protein